MPPSLEDCPDSADRVRLSKSNDQSLSHHRHPSLDMNDVTMWSDWKIQNFQSDWEIDDEPVWKRCFPGWREETISGYASEQMGQSAAADEPTSSAAASTSRKFQAHQSWFSRRVQHNFIGSAEEYRRVKNSSRPPCMTSGRRPNESRFTMSMSGKFCSL
jgi:hypothetical protein